MSIASDEATAAAAELWADIERTVLPLISSYRQQLRDLIITKKPDDTLLTEADTAVQRAIVDCILQHDPLAAIVAEEIQDVPPPSEASHHIYIIDPIDGTAEFVRPDRREFCSVICLLTDRTPTAALVIAPELGTNRSPITVAVTETSSGHITINGATAETAPSTARLASVTRSPATTPYLFERQLAEAGFRLKTRTTSQTIDMVRTAVDLSGYSDMDLDPFALFVRRDQKVWDGAAGMCLALAAGKTVTDDSVANPRRRIDINLKQPEPQFPLTIAGEPTVLQQFDPIASRIHVTEELTQQHE